MILNFKKILKKFDNYLLPNRCLICHRPGNLLCPACRVKIKILPPHCPLCGKKSTLGFICPNCQNQTNNIYFEAVFALGKYEQTRLKISLQTLKRKGLYPLALIIGRMLGRLLIKEWHHYSLKNNSNKKIVIIPIPLSKRCLRTRGFNPAKLLAQGVAEICPWPLDYNLKCHPHSKQKKIFRYQGDNNLSDKTIILIDDVFNTGATANAASYALKQAGAKKIIVVVAAKNL
jgi:predicted amidophosphoribosyltransferase